MIRNWKSEIKLLRYAYGLKMQFIIGCVMLVLDIPIIIIGEMTDSRILGWYMLMCIGMLPAQLLHSLSASNMILASPVRRKLQTSVSTALSYSSMLLIYLASVLLYGVMHSSQGALKDRTCVELLMLAAMMFVIMAYQGICYKYFIVSTLFLCPVLYTVLFNGALEMAEAEVLSGHSGFSFGLSAAIGFGILTAGGVVQYLLSLLVYRAPVAKTAQPAPLRKEL